MDSATRRSTSRSSGNALKTADMPSHAIVDTDRNNAQGLREEWGSRCATSTAPASASVLAATALASSSLTQSCRSSLVACPTALTTRTPSVMARSAGKLDAYKTSPKAGRGNQAYLEMLPKNAEPSS
ncbi:uncharacterized protein LY79DRAFT_581705 [Colletotrichum navitas]|uniref:Uncharacterized protein n=1 Tax=Colletotrichum navitas TaxID=681940 RepID=A0AAD8PUT0_9PEZI|nr:uncharacterized protein LY79DRAFT_581705 [Colletotrichum navitas]KAK1580632.1 hypothetical protein LY79DRAFT_581705 [Colletotrichum navitas]